MCSVMAVHDCQLDYLWNELHSRNEGHTCDWILRQEDTHLVWLHLLLEASVRTPWQKKRWSGFSSLLTLALSARLFLHWHWVCFGTPSLMGLSNHSILRFSIHS